MTDTAAEPLIPSSRHDFPPDTRNPYTTDNDDDTEIHDDHDDEVDESALVSPGLFIWILTICAGVSGLLFGYEYAFFSCLQFSLSTLPFLLHFRTPSLTFVCKVPASFLRPSFPSVPISPPDRSLPSIKVL